MKYITVGQLIQQLQAYDPNLPVVVPNTNGKGYDAPRPVQLDTYIHPNPDWWTGQFGKRWFYDWQSEGIYTNPDSYDMPVAAVVGLFHVTVGELEMIKAHPHPHG